MNRHRLLLGSRTALFAASPRGRGARHGEGRRGCFASMLGGDDGRTLYIVANHYSDSGASDGIVLIQSVAAPHAGRP